MRLTRQTVARLVIPSGRPELIVFDEDLPGFGIRLRAGGKRTWIVQYRSGTKQRRLTLSTVEKLDADKARKEAKERLAKVTLGVDPQAEKAEAKLRAGVTLEAVAHQYLEIYAAARLKPRSLTEVTRHLTMHWAPLRRVTIYGIHRRDVASRLVEIAAESGPTAANRARAALSAMFTWAMREGIAETNPVVGTNRTAPERPRDRVLSDQELVAIWKACRADDYGRIVRLLMLTGQRREEVGGMHWEEIDLKKEVWLIPGERTKNRRRHEVPLAPAACEILKGSFLNHDRPTVFGEREGSFQGWSNAKLALDRRIADAGRKVLDWRIHDLRRTVATRMGDLGVQPHVIEAILNHVSGTKAGIAGIYNRSLYEAEKRTAMARWAEHIRSIVEGGERKVVSIRSVS
jgi:integrase